MTNHEEEPEIWGDPVVEEHEEVDVIPKKPGRYVCVMHNDDYTPMEFVVMLLVKYFGHTKHSAEDLMWRIHTEDKAVVGGPYSLDIAETKCAQVIVEAREAKHPLLITVEKDS